MSLSCAPSLVSVEMSAISVPNCSAVFSNASIFSSSSVSDSKSVSTAPASSARLTCASPYVTCVSLVER